MSNASKPDGTDPRILQPEGEEVMIPPASTASSTRKYHQTDCELLDTMTGNPQPKDIAIARWKGMGPCSVCHGPRMNDNHDGLAIEGPQVDRWRRALVWGECSCSDVAAGSSVHRSSVRRHVCGEATEAYETPPRTPPITFARSDGYEWRWQE